MKNRSKTKTVLNCSPVKRIQTTLRKPIGSPPKRGFRFQRSVEHIKKTLKTHPKYAPTMKPFATPIAKYFVSVKFCELCGCELDTPRKTHVKKTAIDHSHYHESGNMFYSHEQIKEYNKHTNKNVDFSQDIVVCSFRGRLCHWCNIYEGKALVMAKGDKYKHVELIAKKKNIKKEKVVSFLDRVNKFRWWELESNELRRRRKKKIDYSKYF